MNATSFDSLSRFAAGAIPDRARDTVGLAPLARSVTAEGKKSKSKKNKSRKKANEKANELANQQAQLLAQQQAEALAQQQQQCQNQLIQCTTVLAGRCNGDPQCLAVLQRCCPALGTCDTTAFFACLVL